VQSVIDDLRDQVAQKSKWTLKPEEDEPEED